MIKFNIMGGLPESEEFITASENKKNTQIVIDDWMLGPEKPSIDPTANKSFWSGLAKAMQVDEKEARRRRCSNCEYYDNSTITQVKMERIPQNKWDVNAGFRGYCEKFEFICHDLRSCQAWEEREDEED
ncbi:hypothetical protein UFOVP835_67 [uncultured Caudovirales phage]|uniref:Uncharacterized protein n=1 Tax=uncultured Caudovirales phage TaxID=2100421 RepID=A0A6J5P4U4_9CAUD|nr:hypothetical protein UFOVP835_67 [uncultured Caudovirales phage]